MSHEPTITKDSVIRAAVYYEGWNSLKVYRNLNFSNVIAGIQKGVMLGNYPEWLASIKFDRIKYELHDLKSRDLFEGMPPEAGRPILPGLKIKTKCSPNALLAAMQGPSSTSLAHLVSGP